MNYLKTACVCAFMAASAPAFAPVFAITSNSTNALSALVPLNNHHSKSIEKVVPPKSLANPNIAQESKKILGALESKAPESTEGELRTHLKNAKHPIAPPSNPKAAKGNGVESKSEVTVETKTEGTSANADEQDLEVTKSREIENTGDAAHAPSADKENDTEIHHLKTAKTGGELNFNRGKSTLIAASPQSSAQSKLPRSSTSEERPLSSTQLTATNTSVPEIDGTHSGLTLGLLISLVAVFRERRIKGAIS